MMNRLVYAIVAFGFVGINIAVAVSGYDVDEVRWCSPRSRTPNAKRDCDITDLRLMADGRVSALFYKVEPKWRIPFISDASVVAKLTFHEILFDPETENLLEERELPTCFTGNITSELAIYEPAATWLGDSIICSYLSMDEGEELDHTYGCFVPAHRGIACRVTQTGSQPIPMMTCVPMGYETDRPTLLFPRYSRRANADWGLDKGARPLPHPSYLLQTGRGERKTIVRDRIEGTMQLRRNILRGLFFFGLGEEKGTSRLLFVLEDRLQGGPGTVCAYDLEKRQAEPISPPIRMTFLPPFMEGDGGDDGLARTMTLALQPEGMGDRLHYLVRVLDFKKLGTITAYCLRTPKDAKTFRLPPELTFVFGGRVGFQTLIFPFGEDVYLFSIAYIARLTPATASCTILYSRSRPSSSYRKDGRTFTLEEVGQK